MAQNTKHSFNGHRKQSAGFANMAAFIYAGTKRKRRKKVRGK